MTHNSNLRKVAALASIVADYWQGDAESDEEALFILRRPCDLTVF